MACCDVVDVIISKKGTAGFERLVGQVMACNLFL